MTQVEALVRRLEEGVYRAARKVEDLDFGIGKAEQDAKLFRQAAYDSVPACGLIRTTVRRCSDNALVSGATVTVKDDTGATVNTCTTDASGICSVVISEAGTYTVTAVATGQTTTTATVEATCTTNDVTVLMGYIWNFTVKGCNNLPVAGATVALTGTGVSLSGVTNASGLVTFNPPVKQSYSYTVTSPSARLNNGSGSSNPACGTANITVTLTAATGYRCVRWGNDQCLLPVAETLYVTDSEYGGPRTMTWSSGGGGVWTTSGVTVNFPGCNGCPAVNNIPITYQIGQQDTAGAMGISWARTGFGVTCPGLAGSSFTKGSTVDSFACPPALAVSSTANANDPNNISPHCTSPVTYTLSE